MDGGEQGGVTVPLSGAPRVNPTRASQEGSWGLLCGGVDARIAFGILILRPLYKTKLITLDMVE